MAHRVSDWKAAAVQEGLLFVGVMSFVMESEVSTNWLSGIKATTTDDAMGFVAFWDRRAMHAVVIVLVAFQSSSSSSISLQFGMVA